MEGGYQVTLRTNIHLNKQQMERKSRKGKQIVIGWSISRYTAGILKDWEMSRVYIEKDFKSLERPVSLIPYSTPTERGTLIDTPTITLCRNMRSKSPRLVSSFRAQHPFTVMPLELPPWPNAKCLARGFSGIFPLSLISRRCSPIRCGTVDQILNFKCSIAQCTHKGRGSMNQQVNLTSITEKHTSGPWVVCQPCGIWFFSEF